MKPKTMMAKRTTWLAAFLAVSFTGWLGLSRCSKISESGTVKDHYRVIVIDGCEYITVENSVTFANNYSFAITHKGNCKNPIHRSQR